MPKFQLAGIMKISAGIMKFPKKEILYYTNRQDKIDFVERLSPKIGMIDTAVTRVNS